MGGVHWRVQVRVPNGSEFEPYVAVIMDSDIKEKVAGDGVVGVSAS